MAGGEFEANKWVSGCIGLILGRFTHQKKPKNINDPFATLAPRRLASQRNPRPSFLYDVCIDSKNQDLLVHPDSIHDMAERNRRLGTVEKMRLAKRTMLNMTWVRPTFLPYYWDFFGECFVLRRSMSFLRVGGKVWSIWFWSWDDS